MKPTQITELNTIQKLEVELILLLSIIMTINNKREQLHKTTNNIKYSLN